MSCSSLNHHSRPNNRICPIIKLAEFLRSYLTSLEMWRVNLLQLNTRESSGRGNHTPSNRWKPWMRRIFLIVCLWADHARALSPIASGLDDEEEEKKKKKLLPDNLRVLGKIKKKKKENPRGRSCACDYWADCAGRVERVSGVRCVSWAPRRGVRCHLLLCGAPRRAAPRAAAVRDSSLSTRILIVLELLEISG